MSRNVKAYKDKVLIALDRPSEQQTSGGIIMPGLDKASCLYGTVLSAGKECREVDEGDRVIIYKRNGSEYEMSDVDDRRLHLLPEGHILAVVESE